VPGPKLRRQLAQRNKGGPPQCFTGKKKKHMNAGKATRIASKFVFDPTSPLAEQGEGARPRKKRVASKRPKEFLERKFPDENGRGPSFVDGGSDIPL